MSQLNRVIVIVLALLLLSISSSWATTYYVRTDGHNTNCAGTHNASDASTETNQCAWLTIDYAADHVSAEDTVRVQAGTYEERVTPGVNGSNADATVTLVADGAVTMCGVDFTSNSYIRVIGFDMDPTTGACSSVYTVTYVNTNTGLEFWNNTIHGGERSGISGGNVAYRLQNSIIIGNTFYDIIDIPYAEDSAAADVYGSNNLIAHNIVYDILPDAWKVFGVNNRIINNYAYNLGTTEADAHKDFLQYSSHTLGLTGLLVDGNFFIGNGSGGHDHWYNITNNTGGGYPTVEDLVFRRNVVHNLGSGSSGNLAGDAGDDWYYYNNTLHTAQQDAAEASTRYGIVWYNNFADSFMYNNIFVNHWGTSVSTNAMVYYNEDGTAYGDYNMATDTDGVITFSAPFSSEANEIQNATTDFGDAANDNFTIGASSQAIGNGGPLTTVNEANGTGTDVDLANSEFFRGSNSANLPNYGGLLVPGDVITIGTDVVTITAISGNNITFTPSITWANGDPVYFGTDTTPDIGAYPYNAGGYNLTATYSSSGGNVTVTPSDASLVRFVVCFDDGIPTTVDNSSPYTCTVTGTPKVRVYSLYASTTPVITADYDDGNIGKSMLGGSSQGSMR